MLLEIEALSLSRGGTPILRDVNLALAEGQIYGLLGPNGAGKSTTIAAALGLLPFDGGSIRLFGAAGAAQPEQRRRLGVLPEQNGFYDWMSAADYLTFFARLYGKHLGPSQTAGRLAAVGLQPRPGQPIATFSRGMRQRLGLARALIADPALIVLDEPTNGLDPRGRREIHDTLLALAEQGVGILLCTHLLDDVERLCGRIGVIVEGTTVAEGRLEDLLRRGGQASRYRLQLAAPLPDGAEADQSVSVVARQSDRLIVDLEPGHRPDEAWRRLLARGWPIAEVHREGGGLEELYLALTEGRPT